MISSTALTALEVSSNRAPTAGDGDIGRRIRQLRRSQRLTLEQVAAAIGVTVPQLHRYEVGATRVAASRLIAIAKVLRVAPAMLINHTEKAFAPATIPEGSTDLVELVDIFTTIADQRLRKAVVLFARTLAQSSEHGPETEPPEIAILAR